MGFLNIFLILNFFSTAFKLLKVTMDTLAILTQDPPLCLWNKDFLTNRHQSVRMGTSTVSYHPHHWCSSGLHPESGPES